MMPMMPMKPAAVFWDLDGTLIDSDPYWLESERALVEEYGGSWTQETARALEGASLPSVAAMLRSCGVALDDDAIRRRLTDDVLRRERCRLPWVEGARETLVQLDAEGVASVLVTGSPRPIADMVSARAPVGAFGAVICGDDGLPSKPSPEPYLAAARAVGIDPRDGRSMGRCLVFEDSLPGLRSARAAGCFVVAVTGHARVPVEDRSLFDLSIRDYGDPALRSLLQGLWR
ncbi:haloacid dehalogenase [Bifidobacterium samirii]|uniref:Haloacid dehalogenase n=2 Tax=Bifidobacterium samirii TaxID=2306974 RepID=A0A430FWK4_9BIFI|nr:haloacid dehalogenase [Bifidobacterium samirii]